MSGLFPIPSGRTSNALIQKRLLAQIQFDQQRMLQVQDQISTGRAFDRPSSNPQSAVRALTLQRVMEYKSQYQVNLQSSKSFLGATETAISGAVDQVRQVQGDILSAINAPTTPVERQAIVDGLRNALSFLVDVGNTQFRGRYLFNGQTSSQPAYEQKNGLVIYQGQENRLQTFADKQYLIDTNMSGVEVFGGLSEPQISTLDLDPSLSMATSLADLREGRGVHLGTVRISDGNQTADVNLAGAKTVGDVVRRLRSASPGSRELQVDLRRDHLEVSWGDGLGGTVSIEDVDGGRSARDLGIHRFRTEAEAVIEGNSLKPQLSRLTPLADLLGGRASTFVPSSGANNDVFIEALQNGEEANGVHIQWVDDDLLDAGPPVAKGSERVEFSAAPRPAQAGLTFSGSNNNLVLTGAVPGSQLNNVEIRVTNGGAIGNNAIVTFDEASRELTIGIDASGATTVGAVVAAVNAEGTFTAAYDGSVPSDGGYNAAATIPTADIGTLRSNTTQSGGDANTYFVAVNPTSSTALDVVNALNQDSAFQNQFRASLDPLDGTNKSNDGSGRLSFSHSGITQGGLGENLDLDAGLRLNFGDQTYEVRLTGAKTIEDFINRVAQSGAPAIAEIDPETNRLRLRSKASGVDFSIGENGGIAATQLGLRTLTADTKLDALNHGLGVRSAQGTDFVIRRNDGVEFEIDVSSAATIGDVIQLINSHPDNQDAARLEARLAVTGNGIELVDDNPPGTATMEIRSKLGSLAAQDLGLIPVGETVGYPGGTPTPATLEVSFPEPEHLNNAFWLEANRPGTERNGVQVSFVDAGSIGDAATAVFDGVANTLTISIDPTTTTASTVVSAIQSEGTFSAGLSEVEGLNDGSGLIPTLGNVGTTAGGSSQPEAQSAQLNLRSSPPNQGNSALKISAPQAGTSWNGVEVEYVNSLSGDSAIASYDPIGRRLTVQTDASATTAATVVAAINAEGTLTASLDSEVDPTNDGSGLVTATGSQGILSGGTPEVLSGRDVNPQENRSIFDSVQRLIDALSRDVDLREVERLSESLSEDLDRLTYAMGETGARTRAIDTVEFRLQDETINLQATLSQEIDVDMVQAISNLTAQQAAYQASLQMMGRSFQLSLMDFL